MNLSDPDAKKKAVASGLNGVDSSSQHPGSPANVSPPEIPDYELIKRIGQGSYGEVWLARSVMGTLRAVKIVHRSAFESDRPFEREFEGIKRFEPVSQTHESQLKIFHVGRRNGYFYYVMELADDGSESRLQAASHDQRDSTSEPAKAGTPNQDRLKAGLQTYKPRTIRSEIRCRGRLPMDETLEISLKLTEALAHLHSHGLVHRDIKPSNIIFVNGQPKLADIGLVADTEGTLSFVGTEGYLPPEGPGKAPADIFSLGKVLYEISTGHDRNQFPELPTLWNSAAEREAFAEFNEVIIKACAAQVEQRYETTEQMHADLLLLRAGKSLSRVRVLERRLGQLAKLSVAAVALTALVLAGYFYQHHQTRTSKRLAAQLQINNGLRLLDEGDFQGALLWFAEALRMAESHLTPDEQAQHRLRIGTVLQECPKLTQVIVPDIGGGNQLLQIIPRTLTQVIAPGAGDGKVADYGGKAEFSPDGRQILISGYGWTVLLCDAATGKTLQRLEHRDNVKGATFSGDGRRVVTWLAGPVAGVRGDAQIWHLGTGQRIGQPWPPQSNDLIAISHDGTRVLTVSGNEAQVWNADTSQKISPVLLHDASVTGGQFNSDGRYVLTRVGRFKGRTNELVQIWDAVTGVRAGPQSEARATFADDATRMRTRDNGRIVVLDSISGQQLLTIPWPHSGVVGHFFTSDGKRLVLTGWYNGMIQTHDAATGAQIGPTIQQENNCFSGALSPDGARLASSCGKHIHVWDLDTGRLVMRPIPQNDHWRLQFSPDGRHLLTAGGENDPVVRIWDLSGTEPALPPMSHQSWVFHAAFSPDGRRIVTASQDETARMWDAASAKSLGLPLHTNHTADYSLFAHYAFGLLTHPVSGQRVISLPSGLAPTNVFHPVLGDKAFDPELSLPSTNRAVFFTAFAPDSKRVVTASYDGTARIWEAETGLELIPPLKHQGAIYHAAFSRDGRRIVTASADWTAQVWNAETETGQRIGPPLQHQGAVLYADFSPDGRAVVTASYDITAQAWEAETGKKIGPALKHPNPDNGPVFTAKFSPDGQRIVTASYDGTAQVWDARTGRKTTPPLRHRGFVFHAEFSPDGKQVVSASYDQTAQVWNATTGARTAPPLPHAGLVNHAMFSADGKRIVTASFDNTARVWDAATSQPLTPPLRHHDKVWHAEFSPNGKQVLTASSDGTARLWPLAQIDWPVADLRLLAQTLAGRQIDHTGSLSPLAPEVLKENWRKLQSRHPDYFRDSPPKRIAQE